MSRVIRRMRKQLIMIACMALVAGLAIGGTLAWLAASTDPVVNTFTVGNIDIDLNEHELDEDGEFTTKLTTANSYHIIPGATLNKDPFVTVQEGSEACYLFIEVEFSENFPTAYANRIEWTVDGSWTALDPTNTARKTGVYYMVLGDGENEEIAGNYNVLTAKQIKISDDLTKYEVDAIIEALGEEENYTLTITAYAVQYDNVTGGADAAWTIAQNATYNDNSEDQLNYNDDSTDSDNSNNGEKSN